MTDADQPNGPSDDSSEIDPDGESSVMHPTGEEQAAKNREVDPPA